MEKIHMVDLHGQYLKIKADIDNAIQNVIDSTAFINGPQVIQFKKELGDFLDSEYVITCANGTDALQIALMVLDLQPGDEVIVPNFTFIATAEVVALLKLKPVFVDVTPDTFLIDIAKVKQAITPKTKAIIPVHLFGQCVDMQQLMEVAEKNNVFVIEDNAQALGADILYKGKWKKAGTIGHIGCTSFFPSKNLGCYGDGGAIFTNDKELGEEMACIANHGAKVKYHNDIVGVNSRLDTFQAAILSVKLKNLEYYLKSRIEAAKVYDSLLIGVDEVITPVLASNSKHVFHQYTIKVKNRDELKEFLASKDIPTMIYFPVGMNNQKAYKVDKEYEITDMLCNSVLSLPMHTELTLEQQKYIVEAIKSFYKK